MESKTLSVSKRAKGSKGDSNRLRRSGKIPAVIYGNKNPQSVSVDEREFNHKFKMISSSTIINLDVAGEPLEVLIRDFQEDALTGKVTHIDFYEVVKGRLLKTQVPLRLTGAPVGVREGGLLESYLHEVDIECLPRHLPQAIEADISGLNIGQSLHIRDLQVAAEVKILHAPEQAVCAVVYKRAEPTPAEVKAEEAVAEEAAAEGAEEKTEAEAEE